MKFWTRYKALDDRTELFRSIEKIRMVVQAKMDLDQGQSIEEILEYLKEILFQFLKKRKTAPKKFELLVYGESDNTSLKRSRFSIPSFDGFDESLNYFLGVFFHVWQDAFERENWVFGSSSIRKLMDILQELSKQEENGRIIEYILDLFKFIISEGANTTNEKLKSHLNLASFYWYFRVKYRPVFKFDYLDHFEKSLFNLFQLIINKEDQFLFQSFVKELIQGSHQLGGRSHSLDTILQEGRFSNAPDTQEEFKTLYHTFLFLRYRQLVIFKETDFHTWKKDFEGLSNKLLRNVESLSRGIENVENELGGFCNQALYHFKTNQLRLTLIGICAYAFFKKKFDWVYYLLSFNQPPDADSYSANEDVFPNHFKGIIELIANQDIESQRITFLWDDNHGSEKYFKEFFIVLIAHNLIKTRLGGQEDIHSVNPSLLENLSFHRKTSASYFLKRIKEFIPRFKNNKELLEVFKLQEDWIDGKLTEIINLLFLSAEESIKSHLRDSLVIKEKVAGFKENLLFTFHKEATIRNFLKFNTGKPKIRLSSPSKISSTCINQIIEKFPFIQEWNVESIGYDASFAKIFGINESKRLINSIKKYCKPISGVKLLDFILQMGESVNEMVLLGVNFDPHQDLLNGYYNNEDFKWENREEMEEHLEVSGFIGTYKDILPVFCFHNMLPYTEAYLLKKKNIGRLVQYLPYKDSNAQSFFEYNNENLIFYSIQFFSEDLELYEKTLRSKGDLLGQFDNPALELKEKAWLRVVVKSEFEPDENFEGYLFSIPRN